MKERIPVNLSKHVEEYEDRFSNPLYQLKQVGDLSQMLVRGGVRMAANRYNGVRPAGYYTEQKNKITSKSNVEIFQAAISSIGKPHAVSVDLVHDCNYGCKFCYRNAVKQAGLAPGEIDDDLYMERFKYVMDRFEGRPIFVMGGEPFLNAGRLVRVLKYAVEYKNPVKISSNLSVDVVDLADRNEDYAELLEILQENPDQIDLMCSFEDAVPEHHDYRRRAGGFEQSVGNVTKLIDVRVPISANLVVNGQNYKRFEEMLDAFMEMGTRRAYVSFHTHVPRAEGVDLAYELTREQRAEASQIIADVLSDDKYGHFVKGITPEVARMMHPDKLTTIYSEENCPVALGVISLDHQMMPYKPCSFAGEVNCNDIHAELGENGCGLYIPALFEAAKRGEPGAIRQLMEETL